MKNLNTQTKNTPKLRFSEFNEKWEEKRLGDVGPISMCKRIFKNETKRFGDVPFFKIGTFGKTPDAFIDRNLYNEYKQKYPFPKKGDILISASGTIGRLVVYDGLPAYFQDSNIVWIANDEKTVKNKFLFYCYLNTRWTTEDTTIARLYNDNLNKINITVPNLTEQQKIADFLTLVDERIFGMQKKLKLLKKYKKGVTRKIFSQEIRFKNENGNSYRHWDSITFSEIVEKVTDLINPRLSAITYKCVELESLESGTGKLLNAFPSNIQKSTKIKFKKGDILYGKLRPYLNKFYYADFEGVCSSEIWVIRPKKVNNKFLYYLIQSERFYSLVNIQAGSKMPRADWHIVSSALFDIPQEDEQQKIAEFLTAIDDKIKLEERRLAEAKKFKKSLLQQMFV